jgi:hypothetical protein
MSINVYWACLEEEWMRAKSPTNLFKDYLIKNKLNTNNKESFFPGCPAFKDEIYNVYCLKSIYDYSFFIENDLVKSEINNQLFFDNHINIRNFNEKIFSFKNYYIFFSEEKSLKISMFQPYLENNNINNNCIVIPGKFDIGKWYRPLDFAFILKNNYFSIKEKETFAYLKFHTKEKINFIQYKENENLKKYKTDVLNSRNFRLKTNNLDYLYNNFILKNKIINEIKKEII